MAEQVIAVGVITAPHGIRGAVKIKPFTARPEGVVAYGAVYDKAGRAYDIRIERHAKGQLICRVDGVNDRNAAENLRNTWLYINRDQLPEESGYFYQNDLLGVRVEDQDGNAVGICTGFFDFGGGAMLEIERTENLRVLVPFAQKYRVSVDAEVIRLTIDPIWLEDTLRVPPPPKTKAKK